ncbi:DUF29 domain-containing protein [Leptolyngbya sp. NK1-12]|uniref:DUF29 domain-containing protein n=1 Tax=Leptolyngbya sp. NK1-12 TaxID=2547451 RepID=A0AA97AFX5_9CYAN|nr:DUF29 domain-containing protein [Leptolyngbya sp. NK1-12]WNZ23655.1 DUF29 domain-containing protein [Leptolyngbya sp. NK1-12]
MAQTMPDLSLYDQDFVAWCEATVAQLKAQQLAELDLEHLIEEIEGLAGRDRRELENRLVVLMAHLLKRIYVRKPHNYRGWENTIREQRRQLRSLLKQSPSLKNYLAEVFDQCWQDALIDVRANYPQVQFPDHWPFSRKVEALLSREFWQSLEGH